MADALLGNYDPSTDNSPLLGALNSNIIPLLGLAAGLGRGSAPSRLPVPTGEVLGEGASGYLQGLNSLAQQRLWNAQSQNIGAEAEMRRNQILGMQAYREMLQGGGNPPGQPSSVTPQNLLGNPNQVSPSPYATKVAMLENNTGNPGATNSNSTAGGDGQFINSTWLNLIKTYRPDLAQGQSDAQILAMKSDPKLSAQMIDQYGMENAPKLNSAGYSPSNANVALAHHFGPEGAVTLLGANPAAPISSVLPANVMSANPDLQGQTVGSIRQSYNTNFGMLPFHAQAPQILGQPGNQSILGTTQGAQPIVDPRLAIRLAETGMGYGVPGSSEWLKFAQTAPGYQYNQSGGQNAVPGGPADQRVLYGNRLNETLASKEQNIGPNGQVQSLPGADQTAANSAGAISGAQARAELGPKIIENAASWALRAQPVTPTERLISGYGALPSFMQNLIENSVNGIGGGVPTRGATSGTNGGGSVQAQMTPAQYAAEQKLGDEFATKDKQAFDAANDVLGQIRSMNNAADVLNSSGWSATGPGVELRMGAVKTINGILTNLGASPIADPSKVSSWEGLNKEMIRMANALTHQNFGGSRESAFVVNTGIQSVPGAASSPLGFRLVSSGIEQDAIREQDLYNFKAARLASSQPLATAESDFNKAHPPQFYSMRAIANAVPDQISGYLTQHPETVQSFDKHFGPGVGEFILQGGRTQLGQSATPQMAVAQ